MAILCQVMWLACDLRVSCTRALCERRGRCAHRYRQASLELRLTLHYVFPVKLDLRCYMRTVWNNSKLEEKNIKPRCLGHPIGFSEVVTQEECPRYSLLQSPECCLLQLKPRWYASTNLWEYRSLFSLSLVLLSTCLPACIFCVYSYLDPRYGPTSSLKCQAFTSGRLVPFWFSQFDTRRHWITCNYIFYHRYVSKLEWQSLQHHWKKSVSAKNSEVLFKNIWR